MTHRARAVGAGMLGLGHLEELVGVAITTHTRAQQQVCHDVHTHMHGCGVDMYDRAHLHL